MKLRKLTAILLAGVMIFSLTACSSKDSGGKSVSGDGVKTGTESKGDKKLVVWTLADDLKQFADKFMEANDGIEVETVVIAPADYPTKVQAAILGGAKEPDVIVGEPQMLENMYEAGFFEDLNQAPYNAQEYADKIVDYVWKVGQDANGIQRAISYQITPAGIYYRRDIAKTVFGTDDPVEIGKLFADYSTIQKTGETLKAAGYRIFASDAETNYFSGDSAWVIDGKLNVDQGRYDYMDLCVALYQNDLTAFASQWAAPWYQAMSGPVPILTAETQWGTDDMNIWDAESFEAATADAEKTEVFAFGLPAWGVLTMRDNVEGTSGLWGVCSGPSYGFGGGTFIGISSNSARKDLAWEFVKFCTLNESTMDWWIEASQGDTVSYIPTLEKHADDENEIYGGQKLYAFWLEQAKGIDYSKVTKYDKAIGDAWGAAITSVKTGEKSKEDAVNEFYDVVASTYPEIKIER
ncbi:ABC transporter substrate-binding protein [Clostridium sp. Marseille-P299]|uniref:ABC transporter substrate-binding protein n=1 Tax=Clostridium sp. Marseille-P299 TaxID=1805477 RepID=UPI000836544E|nr:ABC transporter substrate-binding protein [Clostridium sp. Marseille-P299]